MDIKILIKKYFVPLGEYPDFYLPLVHLLPGMVQKRLLRNVQNYILCLWYM